MLGSFLVNQQSVHVGILIPRAYAATDTLTLCNNVGPAIAWRDVAREHDADHGACLLSTTYLH